MPGPSDTSVVVGVTLQSASYVDHVRVTTQIAGGASTDETVAVDPTMPFAHEVNVPYVQGGDPNAAITVHAEGLAGTAPAIVRDAVTGFVLHEKRLLRLTLDSRCTQPGTTPMPVMCPPSSTCLAGGCVDEAVTAQSLEPYAADWATDPPDVCKPAGHGDPVVMIGSGQTDYLPITDGQMISMERGPQGGHHIWIATRMKNLRQSKSTTKLTAVRPDDPSVMIPPASFVFTFDPDEGGFCKLVGLRFQLDAGAADLANDYKQYLGKPLDVTVEITDTTGAHGSATAHIVIAPTLICPGTTSC
jgi:hypothetical protein